MNDYKILLQNIVKKVISTKSHLIDENACFPREAITEIGKAGILGLVSCKNVGGLGQTLRSAAEVVEKIAEECGSTAMVICMHYSGVAVIEKFGGQAVRKAIAKGDHLTTLAFSEQGSRCHFWAPLSSAKQSGDHVVLNGNKSWITGAGEADSYVWSSRPLKGEAASSIWLVPKNIKGCTITKPFDGLGLRGNGSSPVIAEDLTIPMSNLCGADGQGFEIMMGTVLPTFSILNASISVGIMEGAIKRTIKHLVGTSLTHLSQSLIELPTIRAYLAKAKIELDSARTLRDDTLMAVETGRADTMLRVLEVKACAGEAALKVTDAAMRVCGGAAFRKEVGVERAFRDARASSVMAPTSDVLYDFIGKAICEMPLF